MPFHSRDRQLSSTMCTTRTGWRVSEGEAPELRTCLDVHACSLKAFRIGTWGLDDYTWSQCASDTETIRSGMTQSVGVVGSVVVQHLLHVTSSCEWRGAGRCQRVLPRRCPTGLGA